MKKVLFSLLAVALVFVGCKQKQDVKEVTSLTLDKTSLALVVGGAPQKLTATVTPADATITWETSNEAVATVNAGIVTAVAEGTCTVTAKAGELTAKCEVTVTTEEAAYEWQFGGCGLFGLEEVAGADTVPVELTIGTLKCLPATSNVFIWGSGLTFKNNVGFTGEDYMFYCPTQVYVIVDPDSAYSDYVGYYVGSAEGFIVSPEGGIYNLEQGQVTEDYAEALLNVLYRDSTLTDEEVSALYEAWDNSIVGSYALLRDADGAYYPFEGLLVGGQIDWDNNDNYYYDLTINWFDYSETAQYGIKGQIVEEEGERYFTFTEPYEMQFNEQHVQNYDFNQTATVKGQYKIINPSLIHEAMPKINGKDFKTFRTK